MKPLEIKPDIHWIGAIDWAVRDFHGYVTPDGTTYNNYLIMDEQITLVDTVKDDFAWVTIDNIKHLTDPSKIANIVINHIEPDHASGLDKVMADYFGAMHDLSVDPTSIAYQGGAITAAESLAFRFNVSVVSCMQSVRTL